MDLNEIRKKIDSIDSEILKLLDNRVELALRTKKLKRELSDPKREEAVLENVQKMSHGLIDRSFSKKLFSQVVDESKRIQSKDYVLIGFQGEHGAYSELAAKKIPSAASIPCTEFVEVFDAVSNDEFDFGVVPVENSLGGSVTQVNDLLIETDLKVVGEINIPIHHCLLVPPGTDYREIRVAYSHPQALSQCRGFLQRNKLEPRPFYDTAGAAKMIATDKPKAAAAIASSLCAELYGLEIIKENIEDHGSNVTRFFVLSKDKSKQKGTKCSMVFSTQHKAGALFSVLKIFADAGINLTRIESRPIRNDPGKFAFLLDFAGSDTDPAVHEALEKTRKETAMFKFLGCYSVIE